MISFKIHSCSQLLLVAVLFPSLSIAADIAEIKTDHDSATRNLFLQYRCEKTETDPIDPAVYNQFGDVLSREEMEGFHVFASFPERTYRMNLTYMIKGQNMRVRAEAPKGTFRPWLSVEEYIINPKWNAMFWIDHKSQLVNLSVLYDPNLGSEPMRYLYFNPAALLFPLSVIEDPSPVSMEPSGDLIAVSWDNPDSKSEFCSVKALLDPSKGYAARKAMMKISMASSLLYDVVYMENENFASLKGLEMPRESRVLMFRQYKSKAAGQTPSANLRIVKRSHYNTLDLIDAQTFTDFQYRFLLALDPDSFSTNEISDETFWPSSPEGYKHTDHRYAPRLNAATKKEELLRLEALSAGTDRHVFPFKIEEK